jgi:hypothetical protein
MFVFLRIQNLNILFLTPNSKLVPYTTPLPTEQFLHYRVTWYSLEGRGSARDIGRGFSRPAVGPNRLPTYWVPGSFPTGLKRLKCQLILTSIVRWGQVCLQIYLNSSQRFPWCGVKSYTDHFVKLTAIENVTQWILEISIPEECKINLRVTE